MSAPTKSNTPVPAKALAYFELAVSLYLWRWQALSLAVENEWGGPDSSDKRDWLAGVLADMFTIPFSTSSSSSSSSSKPQSTLSSTPATGTAGATEASSGRMATGRDVEPEDVEDVAVQVIEDEFSVVLEDDSAYALGVQITGAWKQCLAGDFSTIDALHTAFKNAKPGLSGAQSSSSTAVAGTRAGERSGSGSGSESESSGTDAEVDEDEERQTMQSSDAMDIDSQQEQPRVAPATKPDPIIDEDGFELVQPKQKNHRQR